MGGGEGTPNEFPAQKGGGKKDFPMGVKITQKRAKSRKEAGKVAAGGTPVFWGKGRASSGEPRIGTQDQKVL